MVMGQKSLARPLTPVAVDSGSAWILSLDPQPDAHRGNRICTAVPGGV